MVELALDGGSPAVPPALRSFQHPRLDHDILHRIARPGVLERATSFDGIGLVSELEDQFRDVLRLGGHVLATNSGTSALYAIYHASGLVPGDEVLVPAYTFFATAMPLFRLGCVPVLVDSCDNGNIDPNDLRKKVTSRTRAIMVTHMWGIPCDMAEISAVATEAGLTLLEDVSHAHGAVYGNKVCGSFGAAAAWSLGAKKIVTGGQGGILHSADRGLVERAALVSRANDKQHDRGITLPHLQPYAVTGSGMNLRMHPFSALVAVEQVRALPTQLQERRETAELLARELKDLPGLRLPRAPDGALCSWYAFPLLYEAAELGGLTRQDFVRAVAAEGAVEIDIPGSTCPLDRFRAFQGEPGSYPNAPETTVRNTPADYPGAHRFHNRMVKLPVWYGPDRFAHARAYVSAITKVIANYS